LNTTYLSTLVIDVKMVILLKMNCTRLQIFLKNEIQK